MGFFCFVFFKYGFKEEAAGVDRWSGHQITKDNLHCDVQICKDKFELCEMVH